MSNFYSVFIHIIFLVFSNPITTLSIMKNLLGLLFASGSILSTVQCCFNNEDYVYPHSNFRNMTCTKIGFMEQRRQKLCQHDDVRNECPQTCGLCCEDDLDYAVVSPWNGKLLDCETIQNGERVQLKYCEKWYDKQLVKNACPVACNACKSLVTIQAEENNEKGSDHTRRTVFTVSMSLSSSASLLVIYLCFRKKRSNWKVANASSTKPRKNVSYRKRIKELKEELKQTQIDVGINHPNNAKIRYDIGMLEKTQGLKNKSLESFWAALNILEDGQDHYTDLNIAALYCNIGDVLNDQRDYIRSIKAYKKALSIHEGNRYTLGTEIALLFLKIGEVHQKRGELGMALKTTKNAMSIMGKNKKTNKGYIALAHQRLGSILHQQKKYKLAFLEFRCSLEAMTDMLEKSTRLQKI